MRRRSYWRDRANMVIGPILRRAIRERWDESRLAAALQDAYPFGVRANHPYDVWLDCQREAIIDFRLATSIAKRVAPMKELPLFANEEKSE